MDKNIKISIVVPVYNVEPFIKQCLDSLLNQTLKEIEIILIDDCSPDKSGDICDEYAKIDNRVVVIHNEKNIKQGPTSNKGIGAARGEYLGFVDPDDWVDLDYFEKLYTTAAKNNADIVKTERKKVFSDGTIEEQKKLNAEILKGLRKKKPIFLLYTNEHTTAIFKRETIVNNGVNYPNIRNGLDNLFLLSATYFSSSISIITGTYYYYRQHSNSAISVKKQPYFESILQYFKLHIDFINSHEMKKEYYDLAFTRGFFSVKNRFGEIETKRDTAAFRSEYVEKALMLITEYKYDSGYLLDSFYNGFTLDNRMQEIVKSAVFRVGKVITWLPSKMKDVLK
jgi:glycosyltransferase involved in cell wall biosynthesis